MLDASARDTRSDGMRLIYWSYPSLSSRDWHRGNWRSQSVRGDERGRRTGPGGARTGLPWRQGHPGPRSSAFRQATANLRDIDTEANEGGEAAASLKEVNQRSILAGQVEQFASDGAPPHSVEIAGVGGPSSRFWGGTLAAPTR